MGILYRLSQLAGSLLCQAQQPPVAVTFLQESFAGPAAGTALTSLTPTVGGSWSLAFGYSPASPVVVDQNSAGLYSPTNQGCYVNSATPPSANYYVEAVLLNVLTNSTDIVGIVGRADPASATFYTVRYTQATHTWNLFKFVNGTATQIGANYNTDTFNVSGSTRTVRLTMTDTTVSVDLNGTTIISVADTSITGAGQAGVRFSTGTPSATTGIRIVSMSAVKIAVAPNILTSPSIVTGQAGLVSLNKPLTFTSATATGVPTPTITYNLYENGSLLTANYTSGSFQPSVAGNTYFVRAVASSSSGTAANDSPTLTAATIYIATLMGVPVVGVPTRYTLPSGAPAVVSQQWYSNAGTGPSAISGATSATYVSSSASDGYLSVRGRLADGSYFSSLEFTSTGAASAQSTLQTPIPTAYQLPLLKVANTTASHTLYAPMVVRFTNSESPSYCVDETLGPGSYPAYSAQFPYGALTGLGATSNVFVNVIQPGTPAVIAPVPDTAPATATRPSANTGNGFFIRYGQLYDSNSNKFRMRGAVNSHWNSYPPGIPTSKVNAVRIPFDLTQPWSTNKGLIDRLLGFHCVPVVQPNAACVNFTASITGLTMNVTAISGGRLMKGTKISLTSSSGTIIATVHATASIPTGGLAGTYTLASSSGDLAERTLFGYVSTTGSHDPDVLDCCVQNLIDIRANLAPYDYCTIYDLCNEWGLGGSASDTSWRDACINAVGRMRAAGFTSPLFFDSPDSGQDASISPGWSFVNINADGKSHAQNVWEADPLKNVIFSYHVYGRSQPGDFQVLAQKMNALSTATEMCFVIGEFGPYKCNYNGGDPTWTTPLEVVATCEAYNIGYMAWAFDDPAGATTNTGTYALILNAGNYNAGGGGFQSNTTYPNGNPAELTDFGRDYFLDPIYGTQVLARYATNL